MKNILFIFAVSFFLSGCFVENYSQLEALTKASFHIAKNTNFSESKVPDYKKLASTTYNKDGFNDLGIHKDTDTEYNQNGFNRGGYNQDGTHWKDLNISNPM